MSDIDWSTAPEMATHIDDRYGFFCNADGWWDKKGRYYSNGGVEHGEWGSPRYIPRPTQWRGPEDGLPPAGTECLYHNGSEYVAGKIVAHVDDGDGIDAIIQCDGAWFCGRSPDSFRPMQSERDKAIEEMAEEVRTKATPSLRSYCSVLYDAGYRKS